MSVMARINNLLALAGVRLSRVKTLTATQVSMECCVKRAPRM